MRWFQTNHFFIRSQAAEQAAQLNSATPALEQYMGQRDQLIEPMTSQIEAFKAISSVIETLQIVALQESIQMANPFAGITDFMENISTAYTAAANISLLKGLKLDDPFYDKYLPGRRSFLREIKKRTTEIISNLTMLRTAQTCFISHLCLET